MKVIKLLKRLTAMGLVLSVFEPGRSFSASEIPDLNTGTYLREDYLKQLRESRSPQKAVAGNQCTSLVVGRDKANLLNVMANIQFHEGAHVIYEGRYANPKDRLETDGSDRILFTSDLYRCKKARFLQFSDNLENEISYLVLGGDYLDQNKNLYQFRKDGTALLSDKSSTYAVQLDFQQGPDPMDPVLFGEDDSFAYQFEGDDLLIFEMNVNQETDTVTRAAKPYLVLHRVKQ